MKTERELFLQQLQVVDNFVERVEPVEVASIAEQVDVLVVAQVMELIVA